jgi:hypothetical protein
MPLAAGRPGPESVEGEVGSASFIVGVGKNFKSDVGQLLVLASEKPAEREIVTTPWRTVSVVTCEEVID